MEQSQENRITDTEISKSRFELTLAEFPIFNLSKQTKKKKEPIVYEDSITGKDGQNVKRRWEVLPHPHLGHGTPSTFKTLFDLFQIWKENNFERQSINFGSIYGLIKRRDASLNMQQYRQIKNDLECLVGITIKAKNAFWDNQRKAYVDMTFHLFEHLFLFKEKPEGPATLPFAQIKASDVLFGSILKNSVLIADFDSQFFHSLTPTEQKLSWYLTKVFRSQPINKRELMEFAGQLPLEVKEVKYIKRQIKKACEGLMKKGFGKLAGYDFMKGVDGKTEMVIFRRTGTKRGTEIKKYSIGKDGSTQKEEFRIDLLVDDIMEICGDEKSADFYRKVARCMPDEIIYRTLSEVKEVRDLGEIKKSEGAIFTSLIKKYASERGIKL